LAERAMGFLMSWEEEELHPVTGQKHWVVLPPS
jgi:hypothetical protein